MMIPTNIGPAPVRYGLDRWTWNNGFRALWLATGRRHADAINAARRGDLSAVRAHFLGRGSVSQPTGIARSAIKLAGALPADVPPYRIIDRAVFTPHLSWRWRGSRQVAEITWTSMWGA